jgi:hypothetical protein
MFNMAPAYKAPVISGAIKIRDPIVIPSPEGGIAKMAKTHYPGGRLAHKKPARRFKTLIATILQTATTAKKGRTTMARTITAANDEVAAGV